MCPTTFRAERNDEHAGAGRKARRWVVECHSFLDQPLPSVARALEKKADNYLAFIHLQFAYVTLRAAGVLG